MSSPLKLNLLIIQDLNDLRGFNIDGKFILKKQDFFGQTGNFYVYQNVELFHPSSMVKRILAAKLPLLFKNLSDFTVAKSVKSNHFFPVFFVQSFSFQVTTGICKFYSENKESANYWVFKEIARSFSGIRIICRGKNEWNKQNWWSLSTQGAISFCYSSVDAGRLFLRLTRQQFTKQQTLKVAEYFYLHVTCDRPLIK